MSYQTIQPLIAAIDPSEYPAVVDVWEASVRATHDFLTEKDIQYFKPLILNEYLALVELSCLRDKQGQIAGFMGVAEGKIEMLFIHPSLRGQGIGKRLLQHAIHKLKAYEVDVNEQNPQAVGFYQHLGFEVQSRSELDGQGNPFPLLHLKYKL